MPVSTQIFPLWLSFAIINFVGCAWILYLDGKEGKKLRWGLILQAVDAVVFLFFDLVVPDHPQIAAKIVGGLGLHLTQLLVIVVVALLGFAASEFKLRSKLCYGMVEIFVGVASSAAVVTRVSLHGPSRFANEFGPSNCTYRRSLRWRGD